MPVVLHFVRLARIHPRFQITLLPVVFESLVKIADWQPVVHDFTGVLHGHCEEVLEILVVRLLLKILLLPGVYTLAVPEEHVEVGIEEQDDVFLELVEVQLDWDGLLRVSGVAQQCRLDHHHTVGDGLPHHTRLHVDGLVRWGAEGVDEGTAPEVIYELREVLHRLGQSERVLVVSIEVCEPH